MCCSPWDCKEWDTAEGLNYRIKLNCLKQHKLNVVQASLVALSWRVMPPQPVLKCLWLPFCRHCTVPLAGPFSCDAFVIHIFKRFIDVIDLYLSAQGLCCGAWAHCGGFSRCRAWASWLRGTWDPPGAGSKPVSPSLAGRFLTPGPPGKSPINS